MLDGVNDILKAFSKIAAMDGATIQRAIKPSADKILSEIVAQLPVKTGALRDSYQFVKRRKSNGITIGAKYGKGGGNHSHLVEDGYTLRNGKKVPGHHIERKVFDQNKKVALDEMEKNLGQEVEKIWNES